MFYRIIAGGGKGGAGIRNSPFGSIASERGLRSWLAVR